MRLLLLHARSFCFKPVKPALREGAEELRDLKEKCVENAAVAFVTVEDVDAQNPEDVAEQAAEEIAGYASKVGASIVVVYPYAHLSPKLAPPDVALKTLNRVVELLDSRGVRVVRAPFGWYKEFKLHCYGHPLAELSRSLRPRTTARREVRKEFIVLTPEGEEYDPRDYLERASPEFKALLLKEALGGEAGAPENPVTRIAAKFGFEWEPLSDYGHMRYQPHAALMLEAVSRYAWIVARRLGIPVLRVKGTCMFDLAARPVREHAELFGDRLYELWSDRKHLVLRYAACHQQFSILRDYQLSYHNLPLGMFEVADSYRLEQTGELTLCFRMRRFYMPDLHVLTRDVAEAEKVILERIQPTIMEEAAKLGRSYEAIYNVTRDYWEEQRGRILDFVRREGKPVLVTLYPSGVYYWKINVEYNIIDVTGKPREIATWQIDVGNAERFGITYVDEKGERKHPVIIHTALIGSVERYLYMVFDTAAKQLAEGKTPSIPTWLSPIQVRVIPVEPKRHLSYALEVAEQLESAGVRVDVDDRDLGLGRRIRDAAREWIPYIAVAGDREVESSTLNVTVRRTNDRLTLTPRELVEKVLSEVKGYPQVEPTLPLRVSERPPLVYLEKPVK